MLRNRVHHAQNPPDKHRWRCSRLEHTVCLQFSFFSSWKKGDELSEDSLHQGKPHRPARKQITTSRDQPHASEPQHGALQTHTETLGGQNHPDRCRNQGEGFGRCWRCCPAAHFGRGGRRKVSGRQLCRVIVILGERKKEILPNTHVAPAKRWRQQKEDLRSERSGCCGSGTRVGARWGEQGERRGRPQVHPGRKNGKTSREILWLLACRALSPVRPSPGKPLYYSNELRA